MKTQIIKKLTRTMPDGSVVYLKYDITAESVDNSDDSDDYVKNFNFNVEEKDPSKLIDKILSELSK
jgi:hypothetical protein